ncbi:Vitamin B12 import system permease protein BtuC [Aeromonas salmonicida]
MYLSLLARQRRWQRGWLFCLTLLTLLLFFFSLIWGEFMLLPWQPMGDLEQRILLELRLPRALLAGAAPCCR